MIKLHYQTTQKRKLSLLQKRHTLGPKCEAAVAVNSQSTESSAQLSDHQPCRGVLMMMPKLKTLAEAMAWLAKEIPKSEHKMAKVQTAAHLVTRAAEHGGPMIFAQMGMLQAIQFSDGFSWAKKRPGAR